MGKDEAVKGRQAQTESALGLRMALEPMGFTLGSATNRVTLGGYLACLGPNFHIHKMWLTIRGISFPRQSACFTRALLDDADKVLGSGSGHMSTSFSRRGGGGGGGGGEDDVVKCI